MIYRLCGRFHATEFQFLAAIVAGIDELLTAIGALGAERGLAFTERTLDLIIHY